jgi:transposase
VLKEYTQGHSSNYLSEKYQVPKNTIKTWKRIVEKQGGLNIAKKGRPRDLKGKDYKERYEILKKFQDFLVKQEQKKK